LTSSIRHQHGISGKCRPKNVIRRRKNEKKGGKKVTPQSPGALGDDRDRDSKRRSNGEVVSRKRVLWKFF